MAVGNQELSWNLGLESFLTKKEVQKLRTFLNNQRNTDKRTAWIEWFLVELGLNTGLRVFEMANLHCSDVMLRDELSCIIVKNGKCGKYREVRISREFQNTIREFFAWKKRAGENITENDFILISNKTKRIYTTRGLQFAFKRCLKKSKLPDYHSIHHLRHTYASLLFYSSNYNLRLVQKQLGHSSLNTTQVYANIFSPEIDKAVEELLRF